MTFLIRFCLLFKYFLVFVKYTFISLIPLSYLHLISYFRYKFSIFYVITRYYSFLKKNLPPFYFLNKKYTLEYLLAIPFLKFFIFFLDVLIKKINFFEQILTDNYKLNGVL